MKMKREIQYTILNRDEQEDHDKYQSSKRGRREEEGMIEWMKKKTNINHRMKGGRRE